MGVIKGRWYQALVNAFVEASNSFRVTLGAGSAAIGKLAANDGVDIGDVDVTSVAIPKTIYQGWASPTAPGIVTPLVPAEFSHTLLSGVRLKAFADNTGSIFVGGSDLELPEGFVLEAGEEVFIEIDELSSVYIDAENENEGVSYIAS